ncbi:MAG: hypothetical protein C4339_04440 [Nitrososphaerota archaeon]
MPGISRLVVLPSPYYVKTEELAQLRGVDPQHVVEGLGMEGITVLYDKSLEELGLEALRELDISDAELLLVATESSPDLSKPMGAKILERLGLNHVGTVELKFACVSGCYGALFASERVKAGGGPVAILCVDEALYERESGTAEFTQGAGAVAFRLEADAPLELELARPGYYTADVDDFLKPMRLTPIVDGRLSIMGYIFAMKMAIELWKRKHGRASVLDHLDHMVFHMPFAKMAEWAFASLYAHERMPGALHHHTEEALKDEALYEAWRRERKQVMQLSEFQELYRKKVYPSTLIGRKIGNLYTGSLWASLASLFLHGMPQRGEVVGFGGYGSGLGSMVFTGQIRGFPKVVYREPRERLSAQEYLAWRRSRGLS